MKSHDHAGMMREKHRNMLWPHYVNIVLGLWLAASPFALGYMSDFAPDENVLRVMQERSLPSFEWRNLAMTWSDTISGALIVIFSVLAASPSRRFSWAQWANAVVGFWLLFAPLVFWTPLPEAYANDTLIGALVITFSVLVPMMPGMSMEGMMGGPDAESQRRAVRSRPALVARLAHVVEVVAAGGGFFTEEGRWALSR